MIICRICQKEFVSSLVSHIVRKHSITCDEYKERFNEPVQYMSAESVEKSKETFSKRYHEDAEFRKKIRDACSLPTQIKHWTRKGYTEDEAKQFVVEYQTRFSKVSAEKNKTHEFHAGDKNPMSLFSIAKRNNINILDAKKLTPCYGRTGTKHPLYGKKRSPETALKYSKYIRVNRISKVEKSFFDTLIIDFEDSLSNHSLEGWCVDVFLPSKNVVIEFYGDYWHANPDVYSDDWINSHNKLSAIEIRKRDLKKINDLKSFGYKTIIVWEKDWKTNQKETYEKVKNAIN
jgi:G:T-mismatch repair DNA endonuclease (very short patch repair protein)